MGMIARELELLGRALRNHPNGRYDELYAAQQALSWALDPQAFKSPIEMFNDIQPSEVDCPAYHGRPESGDTSSRTCFQHDEHQRCAHSA